MFERSEKYTFSLLLYTHVCITIMVWFQEGVLPDIVWGLFNFGCRALYNMPWRVSVSSRQVQYNIPTFEALLI